MGRLLATLSTILLWAPAALAQEAAEEPAGIDEAINAFLAPAAGFVAGIIFYSVPIGGVDFPLIAMWLAIAAAFFTVYYGFINFRAFGHAIQLIKGEYTDPRSAGEVSHFQARSPSRSAARGRRSG